MIPELQLDARKAMVIGAGLAGCHQANALAKRGWQVQVIERRSSAAAEASGNAQGVVYAKISGDDSSLGQFNYLSLTFAQRFYRTELETQNGVLYLAHSTAEQKVHKQLRALFDSEQSFIQFLSAEEASSKAGIQLSHAALYFPNSGWLSPPHLCEQLLDHSNIAVTYDCDVSALHYQLATNAWCAEVGGCDKTFTAPVCIIANAHSVTGFTQTDDLPLRQIRGQITHLPQFKPLSDLRATVCGDGYVAPFDRNRGLQSVGATFTLKNNEPTLSRQDHLWNLKSLRGFFPQLEQAIAAIDVDSLTGRTGFRCSSPDYLPLVGPIPDRDAMRNDFARLSKNANANIPRAGTYLKGLYVNLAHGSRGLAYTPLSAELLACQITGEPLPIPADLAAALNPARFLIRRIIRGEA